MLLFLGCGTQNVESGEFGEEYIKDFCLRRFDMVILVTSGRETEVASYLYKEISSKTNIVVLRTKIDEVTEVFHIPSKYLAWSFSAFQTRSIEQWRCVRISTKMINYWKSETASYQNWNATIRNYFWFQAIPTMSLEHSFWISLHLSILFLNL